MDKYTIGCTIEPPIVCYIQKCMLIWKNCVNSHDPFTYYDRTLAPRGFLRSSVFLSDALNYFLPIPFFVLFDEQIAKTKLKKKPDFPYQHTLLNITNDGGLDCASDGIFIHIGGTDSLKQIIHTDIHFRLNQIKWGSIVHPMVIRSI